jgi:hypothetical protein
MTVCSEEGNREEDKAGSGVDCCMTWSNRFVLVIFRNLR